MILRTSDKSLNRNGKPIPKEELKEIIDKRKKVESVKKEIMGEEPKKFYLSENAKLRENMKAMQKEFNAVKKEMQKSKKSPGRPAKAKAEEPKEEIKTNE